MHLLSIDYIEVLQTRAGIKQNYLIYFTKKSVGAQFPVSGQRCGAFRSRKDCFNTSPLPQRVHNFFICYCKRNPAALLKDIENQVIAIRFLYAPTSSDGRCARPELG